MRGSIKILSQFGFEIEKEQKSIYPFSPVYKVGKYIIKRTQFPLENAVNLIKYTTSLERNGIPIVTPVKLTSDNPKQIENDCYICYPFIDGANYTGTNNDIVQAGELLGRIHKLSSKNNTFHLETYNVFDFNNQEVDEHIEKIKKFLDSYRVDIDIQKLEKLLVQAVSNQEELKNASLKWVETPHVYKANNLIYKDKPVLIDPDNAKWIPRTFDLALALLLFHNELSSAPNRIFTSEEWRLFLDGYLTHQTLTYTEVENWNKAVLHVFLDEVMWLMAEVEEDWERNEQRELFVSIANVISNLEKYALITTKNLNTVN